MNNCLRCKRPLKNPTINGMGKICTLKSNRLGEIDQNKTEVKSIDMTYNNYRGNRNYLIKTVDKKKVFVTFNQGKIRCHFCKDELDCRHVGIIKVHDQKEFPNDYEETSH